jgi:hypothetical protein
MLWASWSLDQILEHHECPRPFSRRLDRQSSVDGTGSRASSRSRATPCSPRDVSLYSPNAGRQPLPEAGATQERTLEAVGWMPWLGAVWARHTHFGLDLSPL